MNEYQLFFFFILPVIVAALGWGAVLLHLRAEKTARKHSGLS
jgi:hypothetical protein